MGFMHTLVTDIPRKDDLYFHPVMHKINHWSKKDTRKVAKHYTSSVFLPSGDRVITTLFSGFNLSMGAEMSVLDPSTKCVSSFEPNFGLFWPFWVLFDLTWTAFGLLRAFGGIWGLSRSMEAHFRAFWICHGAAGPVLGPHDLSSGFVAHFWPVLGVWSTFWGLLNPH